MAMPIDFPEVNINYGKPQDWPEGECGGLPAWKGSTSPSEVSEVERPAIVSCWKLNAEDLVEIQRSGVIWLTVCSAGMPPVSIATESPFNAPQPDFG